MLAFETLFTFLLTLMNSELLILQLGERRRNPIFGFSSYLLSGKSLSFGQLRLKAVFRQAQMAQH